MGDLSTAFLVFLTGSCYNKKHAYLFIANFTEK